MLPALQNEGFTLVNGEHYMNGRQVAEILNKKFKHIIRDLKTIRVMEEQIDSGEMHDKNAKEMVHHRDHADSIDVFSVNGIIAKKDSRGYVKEILINRKYCDLLRMYSDFKFSIILYRKWEKLSEFVMMNYEQSLNIAIFNSAQTEKSIKLAVQSLQQGKNLEAANHLSGAVNSSKRVGSIGSKHMLQRKKDIKSLKFIEKEVEESLTLDLFVE
jgi:hypothetical protein